MTRCRAVIGGFGVPTQRDLDFGRQVIRYLEPFTWPDGVVVEHLSFAAHLALHRLHELDPPKLVLVGAAASGEDPPGTVRRRRLDQTPPSSATVQEAMAASVAGATDFDHTLAVLRHWGGLPVDTVIIEVEPGDCSFGLGFSDDLAPCFDTILAMVREELGVAVDFDSEFAFAASGASAGGRVAENDIVAPGRATMDSLVGYKARRDEARFHERQRGELIAAFPTGAPAGVEIASRSLPWSIGLESGSDWHDVIPLPDGLIGVVMGDVPGRGSDAAALKADLRVAVQAYAVLHGHSPRTMVESLDRLVTTTGRGHLTTLVYFTLRPETGEVTLSTAGHCPPLVLTPCGGSARYLHDDFTPALGANSSGGRDELAASLRAGETMLMFTDGLVERPNRPLALGLLELAEAVVCSPPALDALCDQVVRACVDRRRREDDLSILALRRA